MKMKNSFTQLVEAGSAKALLFETEIFKVMTKLLTIGKRNQADSSREYEKLRSGPKGKRHFDDIEF